jgi:hypothetical protein
MARSRITPVVYFVVLALDGIDRDAVVAHQRGGHIILRRQRVGGAQNYGGAGIPQGDHQVGGLAGYMQARRNAHAGQGLRLDELVADDLQHRHGLESPLRAALPHIRQRNILYMTGNLCIGRH